MSRPLPLPAAAAVAAAVAAAFDGKPAAALSHGLRMAASGGDPRIAWGWLTVGLARTAGCMAQQRAATAHRELAARMSPAQLAGAVRMLGLSVQHHVAHVAAGAPR